MIKTVRIVLLIFALGLLHITIGCKDSSTSPGIGDYAFLSGPEGSKITLTYADGSNESVGSDRVMGWLSGQLLEGNYFRQLRIVTDIGTMDLRISVPEDVSFNDIVDGQHELRGTRLLLEETAALDSPVAELFFGFSDDFDGLENATGTVTIEQDINHEEQTYDIVGEIDATIINLDGGSVGISGNFWKQEAD